MDSSKDKFLPELTLEELELMLRSRLSQARGDDQASVYLEALYKEALVKWQKTAFRKIAGPSAAVELTLDFPEDATEEEIKAAVAELSVAATRVHHAAGGSGLQVRDIQIEKSRVLQEVK